MMLGLEAAKESYGAVVLRSATRMRAPRSWHCLVRQSPMPEHVLALGFCNMFGPRYLKRRL